MYRAIAESLVQSPRWRWVPGMMDVTGRRVYAIDANTGRPLGVLGDDCSPIPNAIPDLADFATIGCLLMLVREAWGCDEYRRLTLEPAGKGWCCILRNGRHRPPSRAKGGWDLDGVAHSRYTSIPSILGIPYNSEVEALSAALQSAP